MSDRTDTGQFLTIQEIFDLRIEPLRQDVRMMRQAIEQLSKAMVSEGDWEQMRQQCLDHNSQLLALDERIDKLEYYHSVGMWGFRILVSIGTAVGIAGLIKWMVG